MKNLKSILALLAVATLSFNSFAKNNEVGITASVGYVDVDHNGQQVRIERNPNQSNKIIGDYAKTSRPCPPFCIHPMTAAPGVETIGELEMLNFLNTEVKAGTGLLIDARLPEFYKVETIPTAINIPFSIVKRDNPHMEKVLTTLGVRYSADGKANFESAKTLTVFCNGVWCDQSPRLIQGLISFGYPESRLKYYRAGMQMWKLLGLTTITKVKPM